MASYSLAISVIFFSLAAHHLHAAPATVSAVLTVSTPPPLEKCDATQWHEYCSCHIPTFVLPNPRQHDLDRTSKSDYFQDAKAEFQPFVKLLNTSCHEKLKTLLCFFYFPLCLETDKEVKTAFPCKELCLDVTDPNGQCEQEMRKEGLSWSQLEHFGCETYMYKGKKLYKEASTGQCVNNSLPYVGNEKCVRPTTPAPTTPAPTTPKPTTQPPTQEPCSQCDEEPKCSKNCAFRNSLSGKTFSNNNHYNFAAKVKFVSYTTHNCRSALNFTLVEQYTDLIKSRDDCESAPTIPNSFLFMGEHRDCEEKHGRTENECFMTHNPLKNSNEHLEVGETYLISGSHKRTEDGCDQWLAVDRPLIAKWTKKVKNGISNSISKRTCAES